MSKRFPESGFTLDDTPTEASKRVLTAFTGGRATVEEQTRLGGMADICPVYDLYRFHVATGDEHSERVYDECVRGTRMCGECKREAAGLVRKFLEDHHKRRDALMGDARELLEKSRSYLASTGK
jgi:tryptophanyl-tRNA synthetase